MMDTLRIRSCCCMSLHTAGMIIGTVELLLAIVSTVLLPVLMISLLAVIGNFLWLFGICAKNHRLLVPSLIVATILCLWSVMLPIISLVLYELGMYRQQFNYMAGLFSVGAWIIVALCAFIWILKYSIYKHMIESTVGSHIDGDDSCSSILVKETSAPHHVQPSYLGYHYWGAA